MSSLEQAWQAVRDILMSKRKSWPISLSSGNSPWWAKTSRPSMVISMGWFKTPPQSYFFFRNSLCRFHGRRHFQSLAVLGNIVYTENPCTILICDNVCGNGARQPFAGAVIPHNRADESLSRSTDHQRQPQGQKPVEMSEDGQVVLQFLAEADTWIEDDVFRQNAARYRPLYPLLEECRDLGDDIIISRILLHIPGLSLHVHEADPTAGRGDDGGHFIVAAERGYIIDHFCAGFKGFAGDLRFAGIDRNGYVCLGYDCFNHRQHPLQFFIC